MRFCFLRCVVATGLLATCAARAQDDGAGRSAAQNEDGVRAAFQERVRELICADKWDELEDMAAQLRRSHARWPGGMPKFMEFYYGVESMPQQREEKACQDWIERAKRWFAAKPESVAAHIALADAYYDHAWLARGGDYGYTISEANRKLFDERLAKAAEILDAAAKLPAPNAEIYVMLMDISGSQSGWNPGLEENFKKAVAIDPAWYGAYFRKAHFLLPRWGGEPGAWAAFAEESARRTQKDEGMSLYTRIVWVMTQNHSTGEMVNDGGLFARNNVSWPLLKQGFADIEARYPGSTKTLNTFCYFACLAGDRAFAGDLFKRIGDEPEYLSWHGRSCFERWKMWADPATPKELTEPERRIAPKADASGKAPAITCLRLSPDGKQLTTASRAGIEVWDLKTEKSKTYEADGRANYRAVAFSTDGSQIATTFHLDWTNMPGVVRLWDLASGDCVSTLAAARDSVAGVLFTPDGKSLIATGGDQGREGEVVVWDLKTKAPRPFKMDTKRAHYYPALSRDGTMIALDDGSWITVMDVAQGKVIRKWSAMPGEGISGLVFTPGAKTLACVTTKGKIALWDPRTGKRRPVEFAGHGGAIRGLVCTPDGGTLITSGSDMTIRWWNIANGQQTAMILGHPGYQVPIELSADGRTLVCTGEDGVIDFWNTETVLSATEKLSKSGKAPQP